MSEDEFGLLFTIGGAPPVRSQLRAVAAEQGMPAAQPSGHGHPAGLRTTLLVDEFSTVEPL